jgi:hypothetical protein
VREIPQPKQRVKDAPNSFSDFLKVHLSGLRVKLQNGMEKSAHGAVVDHGECTEVYLDSIYYDNCCPSLLAI